MSFQKQVVVLDVSYRFDVLAALFVVRLVLFFPLVEVDFEPVLFDFVRQQSVPVGTGLFLLQGELDGSGADSVFRFLQKNFRIIS